VHSPAHTTNGATPKGEVAMVRIALASRAVALVHTMAALATGCDRAFAAKLNKLIN